MFKFLFLYFKISECGANYAFLNAQCVEIALGHCVGVLFFGFYSFLRSQNLRKKAGLQHHQLFFQCFVDDACDKNFKN